MPKISDKKVGRIKEDIIYHLFESNLKPLFTSEVADKVIRDEEFTLRLLKELKKGDLIDEINKNSVGKTMLKRKRWILKPNVYSTYKSISKR